MTDTEIIKLTPELANKKCHEGWVLVLAKLDKDGKWVAMPKKEIVRPSKEPREYFVLGKWEHTSSNNPEINKKVGG